MHVLEEFRQVVQQCTGVRPGRTEAVDLLLESALGPNGWYRLRRDGGGDDGDDPAPGSTPGATRAQQAGQLVCGAPAREQTAAPAVP